MARYLTLRYDVVDNFADPTTFQAKITLTNTGPGIPRGNNIPWSLYFSHSSLIEPDNIRPSGLELDDTGVWIYNVNGYLNKIVPTASFPGIPANKTLEIPFRAAGVSVARTDVMPNWYLVAPNANPRTIASASGESLDFVGAFDTKRKYKRQPDDLYSPYTVSDRYRLWADISENGEGSVKQIIPTPLSQNLDNSRTMKIKKAGWVVIVGNDQLTTEGRFLAGNNVVYYININLAQLSSMSTGNY